MEKNMQTLQPRTLTNTELIRIAADELGGHQSLPIPWQMELLRRFAAFSPSDEPFHTQLDPRQGELFK
jgi:hypothetical protein